MADAYMSDFLHFIGEKLTDENVEALTFVLEGFKGKFPQNFSL